MKLRVLAAVAAWVFSFSPNAFAGTVGGGAPTFSIDITAGASAPVQVTPTLIANGDGTYSVGGSESVPGSFSLEFTFLLDPDPAISGSFTLRNLSTEDRAFSVSASMGGLLAIAAPTQMSGFYGETDYADTSMNGTLGLGADPFYQATIDGFAVSSLGSFAFAPISSQPPGVIGTLSQETFGPAAGPGVSGTIGVRLAFTLTAGDQVSAPFAFVVVPEPALSGLFAMSLTLFLCGIARETASSRGRSSGRI